MAADLNQHNLVMDPDNANPRIYLIDGFGDHRMISLRGLIRRKNHKSLRASFTKIARHLDLDFDPVTLKYAAKNTKPAATPPD